MKRIGFEYVSVAMAKVMMSSNELVLGLADSAETFLDSCIELEAVFSGAEALTNVAALGNAGGDENGDEKSLGESAPDAEFTKKLPFPFMIRYSIFRFLKSASITLRKTATETKDFIKV